MKKILLFLLIPLLSLHSEIEDIEDMSNRKIIRTLNSYIERRDEEIIKIIEQIYNSKTDYLNFEAHILNEAKDLVDQDDLAFPLFLVETILTNNLESSKAQSLYVAIINRKIEIEDRAELDIEKEEVKRELIEELSEEIKDEVEEQEFLEEVTTKNRDIKDRVTKARSEYKERRYINNTYFYPFSNSIYSSEAYDEFTGEERVNNIEGFGIEMGMGLSFDKFIMKFDMSGNLATNDAFSNELKHITSIFNLSLGLPSIPIPLYLRSGFIYDLYQFDKDVFSNVAITELPSNTLGVGLSGLKLFRILKVDLSVDFLLAPIYTDNLDSGILTRAYLTLNLFRFSSFNIEIRGGLDNLWLYEDGLSENNMNPKVGFGISRYE